MSNTSRSPKELLELLLLQGNVTRFFQLCATEGHDPLALRYDGINLVTALLLANIIPEAKVKGFEAMMGGYQSLTKDKLAALLDEEVVARTPNAPKPRRIHALILLAENLPISDFELLYALMRSKGYNPSQASTEEIEQILKYKHPLASLRISQLLYR